MVQKARIGVIGTGWWSTTAHIPSVKNNPQAELVALCDRNVERLNKAAEFYGPVKRYSELQDMLTA